jgi:uncharacterized repeat protein (TIGR03806 family)
MHLNRLGGFLVAVLLCVLTACGAQGKPATATVHFYPDTNPALLSEWGVLSASKGALRLSTGVVPYDLNTPLFTDYAHKLRTIYVPEGKAAAYRDNDYPDFPVGTIISKTFYYPRASGEPAGDRSRILKASDSPGKVEPILDDLSSVDLVETRLLVRREKAWEAISYVWNDEQTDAKLTRIGAYRDMTIVDDKGQETDFTYVVPNTNQCAGCHALNNTTRVIAPLGVRPRHLNKLFDHGDGETNQLEYLAMIGYLKGAPAPEKTPRNADWKDESLPVNDRARAYLDINCSHCHNLDGPADTSGLYLTPDIPHGEASGRCKLPIAAGGGTGNLPFDIVPGHPDDSVLIYRMGSTDPGAMMPELGRSLRHDEGVALIREWIQNMDGSCAG